MSTPINEHFVIILNPKSGSAGEDFALRVEAAFTARGADFEIRETTKEIGGDQLARDAVREGVTNLVACGGDGTIMAVVNGIAAEQEIERERHKCTLSIVPGGTANLIAAALGISGDLDEAVKIALAGEDRTIDLGKCGPHYFALGVGVGLTERLVSQTSAEEKEKLGKLAYAKAMLKDLGARPAKFSFKLDNRRSKQVRGVGIIIGNSGSAGGNLEFAPRALMDDGKLDLVILHRFWVRDALRMLWNGLWGRIENDRMVSFYQAKRIEIRSIPPLDSQIDGEEKDVPTPLVAEVVPGALKVRVPRENLEEAEEKKEEVEAVVED